MTSFYDFLKSRKKCLMSVNNLLFITRNQHCFRDFDHRKFYHKSVGNDDLNGCGWCRIWRYVL